MTRLEMKNCYMMLTEKQEKYQVNLLEKTDKYEYLIDEKILLFNQRQIMEEAEFAFFLLGKAFEKQTKMIEDQGKETNNGRS